MIDKVVDLLKESFRSHLLKLETLHKNELYLEVPDTNIKDVCKFIYTNLECTLISLFASDERTINGSFSVYYVFAAKKYGFIISVVTRLDCDRLMVQSITSDIPAANLYERYAADMYGIHFTEHPDGRELALHGNWPEQVHPLRKDFDITNKPPFVDREQEFVKIDGTGVFEIPVGPVHAGIIEPGHFRFSVAGEPIINLEAKLFYVHKGIEKLSENQNFEKVLFISERISGDETYSNSLAYCQAIEKISGIYELSPRAEYTRVILSELERVYNHIGDISGICVDVAYGFASSQFAMMRRWCQMLNEEVTGSRFLRSANRPGGVRKDFIKNKENVILSHLAKLEREFSETEVQIKSNSLFIDRVENTGIVQKRIAIDLNAVGPACRAAGLPYDIRRNFPYAAYGSVEFDVPVQSHGDVSSRLNIKIDEVKQSIRIIREALQKMPPEGSFLEPVTKLEPYRYAFGITESPRGENCHWVMSGENNTIFRYWIRTPSFCNWPVLCHAVKGNIIPDFPLINKSFNLSYSGNDL